jgi:hypothetical protein
MNELNYGSREACQRLVDAGIVLETENGWKLLPNLFITDKEGNSPQEWKLVNSPYKGYKQSIPAVQFAEVWRELPFNSYIKQMGDLSLAWICDDDDETKTLESDFIQNINPTDALIDLLIWIRGKV